MVELSKPNMTPTRLETVVENLIWASAGNEIASVVANGQILIDNYSYLKVEKGEILQDIQKLADLFEAYKNKAVATKATGAHGIE